MGVDDAAVGDAEIIESSFPGGEAVSVGAAEGDVVQSGAELGERVVRVSAGVFVEAEQRAADKEHGVVEAAVGRFVEDWLGADESLVLRSAHRQVGDGHGDVADAWEVVHAVLRSGEMVSSRMSGRA